MTLLQIATLAAQKFGRPDDEDTLTYAKAFAGHRYRVIWDDQLWRDSVASMDLSFAVAPAASSLRESPAMSALGIVVLPPMVSRVVAIRRAEGEVRFNDMQALFRCDLDQFAETGTPTEFHVMSAMCGMNPTAAAMTITGAAADYGLAVTVAWQTIGGRKRSAEFTLSATPSDISKAGYETDYPALILSATKPATSEPVVFKSNGVTVATMQADESELERSTAIRILPVPTEDTAFKALVKVAADPMVNDGDETQLRGCDNILVGLTLAELLQWDRQHAKAAAVNQEAAALLDQLVKQETAHEAFHQRLIPGDSYTADDITGKSDFLS